MKFLVTGCNGWIGRQVCKYLTSQNIEVVGADICRTSAIGSLTSDFFPLDITKPIPRNLTSDIGSLISGITAVIHCAGYAHRPNETPEEQKMFYAVNRDGTKHVLDWCEQQGIKRFLYVSSIAFYDFRPSHKATADMGQGTAHEGAPISLPTHYARSKYEGEQLVVSSSLDWRVVRLATVFGEGDRANFSRMVTAMKKRIFPIPGAGNARKSVIPVSLAAELIAQFTLMDSPPHQLINLGLPSAPSLREIADAYHAVCGFPRCPSIPMPVANGLGRCGDLAAKLLGKFPFTSDTLSKLTTSTEVSVERMQECFPERKFGAFEDYLKECLGYYSSL